MEALKTKKDSFTRVLLIFTTSNLAGSVLNMIAGLITARLLGPYLMGIYGSVILIKQYAVGAQLGIINGFNRELPYYFGKGEYDKAKDLAATAKLWSILIGGIFFIVVFSIGIYFLIKEDTQYALTWFTVAAILFFYFYSELYLRGKYRTNNEFNKLSKVNFLKAVYNLFSVLFIVAFGYIGYLIKNLSISLVETFLLNKNKSISIIPKWSKPNFNHLFKIGFPILLVGYIEPLWYALHYTIILKEFGTEGLGLFALATIAYSTFAIIPQSLNQILYPKLSRDMGEGNDFKTLFINSLKPGLLTFLVILPLGVIAWWVLPFFVDFFLPNYADGIEAAKWNLLPAMLLPLGSINNVFIVVKKNVHFAIVMLSGLFVYLAAWYFGGQLTLEDFPILLLIGKAVSIIMSFLVFGYLLRKEKTKN